MTADVALVFPPVWYYSAHPADLSYVAGWLRAEGLEVRTADLNARLVGVWFGAVAGALRDPATYADRHRHAAVSELLKDRAASVSRRFGVSYTLRRLDLAPGEPSVTRSWTRARAAGLSPSNPAGALLRTAARSLAGVPTVAIALVHPDQVPHAAAFARLLREEGHRGVVALYGVMEDVLSPLDFAPDLEGEPRHAVFEDVDAVVLGEGEEALAAVARRAWGTVRGVIAPAHGVASPRPAPPLDLARHPGPSFADLRPHALSPAPVVDLRASRGCPWGRCRFCAIARHQEGFRVHPIGAVAAAMAAAHARAGSVFFRLRDDLLTSRQVRGVADAVRGLPFPARWSCRTRIEPSFSPGVFAEARAGGLEEVWVGLESAVERVRQEMDKGVSDVDVERYLDAAAAAGVRVRLLCLAGYPGETPEEARATLDFVARVADRVAAFSLTPFQLARRAPLAAGHPDVRLLPDPVPRHDRVGATLPCVVQGGVDAEALVREAYVRVLPRFPPVLGPDPFHDWMAASVAAAGWPACATVRAVEGP